MHGWKSVGRVPSPAAFDFDFSQYIDQGPPSTSKATDQLALSEVEGNVRPTLFLLN